MASGPTRETTAVVDERDSYRCARCARDIDGGSRHHRQLRRFGDHSAANLVLLCGSGTTGCHGWVHANPSLAYATGLMVHSWHDPASVPARYWSGWFILTIEGHKMKISDARARELMRELGLS